MRSISNSNGNLEFSLTSHAVKYIKACLTTFLLNSNSTGIFAMLQKTSHITYLIFWTHTNFWYMFHISSFNMSDEIV